VDPVNGVNTPSLRALTDGAIAAIDTNRLASLGANATTTDPLLLLRVLVAARRELRGHLKAPAHTYVGWARVRELPRISARNHVSDAASAARLHTTQTR